MLNCGSSIDDGKELLERYKSFEIRIVQRERGIKLEIKGAPAIAFVDGKMIKGIHEHLFAVLRDIVFISNEVTDNPKFDLSRTEGITDSVFHILRNANVLQPQRNPNLVVCWGGHSINRIEYNYSKEVGYQMGLRDLDICTGCGPGAMKGPMKGATIGHAKQRLTRRALSGHLRAGHHRRRIAQPDRQRPGDHAGYRKAPGSLRAHRSRHHRVPGRRRHGRGDPVHPRHPAASG